MTRHLQQNNELYTLLSAEDCVPQVNINCCETRDDDQDLKNTPDWYPTKAPVALGHKVCRIHSQIIPQCGDLTSVIQLSDLADGVKIA